MSKSQVALEEGMNALLSRKGIVLEVQKQYQKALFSRDERTTKIFDELSEVRSHLTRMNQT